MNQLDPDLKRLVGWARLAPLAPRDLPFSPGLVTRVRAEVRGNTTEEISTRWLGAILLTSTALALAWVFVFLDSRPVGSEQTFNELAARMVTRVGR